MTRKKIEIPLTIPGKLTKVVRASVGEVLRIVAIDPGSHCCGISILELNLSTGDIFVTRSDTTFAKDILGKYKDLTEEHGERLMRNLAYRDHLYKLLGKWSIDAVVCESAFARRVQVYQALIEHTTLLKTAVFNHNKKLPFLMVEPSVVKKNIGVKGNSGDKSLITKGLRQRIADGTLDHCDTIDFDELDEHSIDSIAIGLCLLDRLKDQMVLVTN